MKYKKYNIFHVLLGNLLLCILGGCNEERRITFNPQQQSTWNEIATNVASWTDALGMHIDPIIQDTIIILNILGFKTSASCEGHLDWGNAYPWIDFNTQDENILLLISERQHIQQQIQEEETRLEKEYPTINRSEIIDDANTTSLKKLYSNFHDINTRIEQESKIKLLPLKQLLDTFYAQHKVDHDCIITIHELSPIFLRMYSIGADWQIIRNDDEKKSALHAYQHEMKEFTNFLMNTYAQYDHEK